MSVRDYGETGGLSRLEIGRLQLIKVDDVSDIGELALFLQVNNVLNFVG